MARRRSPSTASELSYFAQGYTDCVKGSGFPGPSRKRPLGDNHPLSNHPHAVVGGLPVTSHPGHVSSVMDEAVDHAPECHEVMGV
jgi:hypothetical protein